GWLQPDAQTRARLNASYGQLPLSFEVNQGQADSTVKFRARGTGYQLYLTATEAVLQLQSEDRGLRIEDRESPSPARFAARSSTLYSRPSVLRMRLLGANSA